MQRKLLRIIFSRRVIVALLLAIQLVLPLLVLAEGVKSQIATILTIFSVCVVLYIINASDKSGYKMIWIILICIFPIFGGLIYFFFKFQSYTGKMRDLGERFADESRALAEKNKQVLAEAINADGGVHSQQINYLVNRAGFPIYNNCGTEYQSPGEVHFESLIRELESAEKFIFMEYYIIDEGAMWSRVYEILKKKVKQGVEVRLIYDDMGTMLKLPSKYYLTLRDEGIKAKAFNEFRPVWTSIQNNRDHRKIVVIDGKTAFTGGINLADEYINKGSKFGHWKDSAVMVKGEAVKSFTIMFLQMWNADHVTDESIKKYLPEVSPKDDNGYVIPYTDSPMDSENVGEHVYMQMITGAKKYVYIVTPYLIIDDNMLSALTLAAKSGIDIRIMTPGIPDKRMVNLTTKSFYLPLMEAGVKIYEYEPGFVHSKLFVCDDEIAIVGSSNLDYRSMYLSFECGLWMYKTSSVESIKGDIIATFKKCREMKKNDIKVNIFQKFVQIILRLAAPLM